MVPCTPNQSQLEVFTAVLCHPAKQQIDLVLTPTISDLVSWIWRLGTSSLPGNEMIDMLTDKKEPDRQDRKKLTKRQ